MTLPSPMLKEVGGAGGGGGGGGMCVCAFLHLSYGTCWL